MDVPTRKLWQHGWLLLGAIGALLLLEAGMWLGRSGYWKVLTEPRLDRHCTNVVASPRQVMTPEVLLPALELHRQWLQQNLTVLLPAQRDIREVQSSVRRFQEQETKHPGAATDALATILRDPRRLNLSNFRVTALPASALWPSADFRFAYLRDASFEDVDMKNSDLRFAFAECADFTRAQLENARLSGSSLDFAIFDPASVPKAYDAADIHGLKSLRYAFVPEAVSKLRAKYAEAHISRPQRELTMSMQVHQQEDRVRKNKALAYFSNLMAFGWTVSWGDDSGRALRIILYLVVLCSPLHYLAMRPGARGAIWILPPKAEDRVPSPASSPAASCAGGRATDTSVAPFSAYPLQPATLWGRLWRSLFYSLLAAVRIGYKDLNIGEWIARMAPEEYVWKPTGWLRPVVGVQMALSTVMVALFILSHWHTLFD